MTIRVRAARPRRTDRTEAGAVRTLLFAQASWWRVPNHPPAHNGPGGAGDTVRRTVYFYQARTFTSSGFCCKSCDFRPRGRDRARSTRCTRGQILHKPGCGFVLTAGAGWAKERGRCRTTPSVPGVTSRVPHGRADDAKWADTTGTTGCHARCAALAWHA